MSQMHEGDTIDSMYRLARLIRRGELGEVYEAERTDDGARLAVKVFRPHVLAGGADFSEYQIQMEMVCAGDHLHLVQVHDFGERSDGTPTMVMDLVRGDTLARRVRRGGPLPPADVVLLLQQVASVLDHLGQHGVVHGDLKPGHLILQQSENKQFFCTVLDPGSRCLWGGGGTSDAERVQAFMAPELLAGGTAAGPATDIYGMGAVAYTALCGKPPFSGRVRELAEGIGSGAVPPVSELNPRLSGAVDRVVAKAMSRHRSERFARPKELVAALDEAVRTPRIDAAADRPPDVSDQGTGSPAAQETPHGDADPADDRVDATRTGRDPAGVGLTPPVPGSDEQPVSPVVSAVPVSAYVPDDSGSLPQHGPLAEEPPSLGPTPGEVGLTPPLGPVDAGEARTTRFVRESRPPALAEPERSSVEATGSRGTARHPHDKVNGPAAEASSSSGVTESTVMADEALVEALASARESGPAGQSPLPGPSEVASAPHSDSPQRVSPPGSARPTGEVVRTFEGEAWRQVGKRSEEECVEAGARGLDTSPRPSVAPSGGGISPLAVAAVAALITCLGLGLYLLLR